jgi:UDP-4-amino-4,6-dideoxy-N-acetyl-beta-L-altrosamine transaminase
MIEAFERAVSDYVGSKYAVAVSSGTAALHLAYLAAGVGSGDLVVTSPITFVATANAARFCGANVLFSDINLDTFNMCSEALSVTLSENSNVKVVAPVHFAGLPCDVLSIKKLADELGAVVVEDASHALGAVYPSGKRVGSCENSLMTIFSFHPVKSIAAGEGGMITTNDYEVYRNLLRLRSHGINKLDDPLLIKDQAYTANIQNPWYYEMQSLGFNFRLTDIQASLATSQLAKLDKFMAKRELLARRYDHFFQQMPEYISLQHANRQLSANHIYVVRFNFGKIKLSRAEVMLKLLDIGVGSQVHYMPIPMHPYYKKIGFSMDKLINSQHYYDECLSLPIYYDLTEKQQNFVMDSVADLINKYGSF